MGAHFADRFPSFGRPQTQDASAAAGDDETLRQVDQTANPVAMDVGQRQHLLPLFDVPQFDTSVT